MNINDYEDIIVTFIILISAIYSTKSIIYAYNAKATGHGKIFAPQNYLAMLNYRDSYPSKAT